ncbi:SMC-Scp complex subunit ScpB [Liquorilactobacillus hordei]|uniref:Segregation and condensation protein B n=1 Tax=Liquorilactobacillus hordei DSM 19519 TaxID=1423759 RepID=A0A0R1MKK3_9LACO|nr:SMC-Scp complex subunit ScpB [Liquorilactobacillus hordei]KRL08241.1 segregation and condensation protein B [Liquorilactobacillus hordei DSM 19519]QYH52465.1 SMC-Scp complex subunit ScpB [Liquorilactobacillus hordei DSM 19519]
MQSTIQAEIEALLFVAGNEGISLAQLSQLTGLMKPAVIEQIGVLNKKYVADEDCCLEIIVTNEFYRLATKSKFAELLKNYFEAPNMSALSRAALETLAIIAYQQPVTRVRIDEIRGVKSHGSIQKLLAFELIEEAGRLEAPGRPILYKTTENFLNYFGLHSLDELPSLPEISEEGVLNDGEQNLLDLFNETLEDGE